LLRRRRQQRGGGGDPGAGLRGAVLRRQPPLKEVDKIKAPLLLHYAGLDSGINEGWPAYEQALKEHHKVYEAYLYQGVNHGFHNDSTPRYDRAAADLAWQRTLAWFEKYLR
jgi:carboxymethylenebutenolidase